MINLYEWLQITLRAEDSSGMAFNIYKVHQFTTAAVVAYSVGSLMRKETRQSLLYFNNFKFTLNRTPLM